MIFKPFNLYLYYYTINIQIIYIIIVTWYLLLIELLKS